MNGHIYLHIGTYTYISTLGFISSYRPYSSHIPPSSSSSAEQHITYMPWSSLKVMRPKSTLRSITKAGSARDLVPMSATSHLVPMGHSSTILFEQEWISVMSYLATISRRYLPWSSLITPVIGSHLMAQPRKQSGLFSSTFNSTLKSYINESHRAESSVDSRPSSLHRLRRIMLRWVYIQGVRWVYIQGILEIGLEVRCDAIKRLELQTKPAGKSKLLFNRRTCRHRGICINLVVVNAFDRLVSAKTHSAFCFVNFFVFGSACPRSSGNISCHDRLNLRS